MGSLEQKRRRNDARLVVYNTHRQQQNLQARNPCSVQETISSQNGQAQSFRYGFLSQVAPIRYGVIGCRCNVLTVNECGRPLRQGQHGCRFRTLSGCQQSSVLCCCLWKCVFGYTKLCLRSPDVHISLEKGCRSSNFSRRWTCWLSRIPFSFDEMEVLTFPNPFVRRNGNSDFPKSVFLRNANFDFLKYVFDEWKSWECQFCYVKLMVFVWGWTLKLTPNQWKSGSRPPRALRASPQGTKMGALNLTNDSFW